MEPSLPFSCAPLNIMGLEILIPVEREVKLHYQQQQLHGNPIDFPYWTRLWASAVAMANMIENQHELFKGKHVMEAGAGLALPSFIAAQYAHSVIATDYLPAAITLIDANIQKLGIKNIKAVLFNWETDTIDTGIDILLLSDINYEPSSFHYLHNLINSFLSSSNKTIFITTPQRLAGKEFIHSIETFTRYSSTSSVYLDGITTSILCLRLES